jgi:predicted permease
MMTSLASALKLSPAILSGSGPALSAAGKAMAELGVAGCIGAACVKKGYVTAEMIRALSKTTFSILLPMFLGTGIIKTVSTYGLSRSSLGVPMIAVLHAFSLYMISKSFLLPLFGMDDPDRDEDRATAVSCAWGNSGVVPLIFAEALFRTQPELLAQSYAQVSLFLVGWSPFFWSFGRQVLIKEDDTGATTTIGLMKRLAGLKRLFPPPVIGVMAGLAVAVSPLRPLILSSALSENTAPLGVVYNSFQNLGRAANPLALLVLTSSLALGASTKKPEAAAAVTAADAKAGIDTAPRNPLKRWACVSIARFVMSPLLMLGLLRGMAKVGMVRAASLDPMLWFILLLQSSMPPAQNSVLMLQVAEKGDEASRMARFLFSLYATAMLPVVIIVTLALRALQLA